MLPRHAIICLALGLTAIASPLPGSIDNGSQIASPLQGSIDDSSLATPTPHMSLLVKRGTMSEPVQKGQIIYRAILAKERGEPAAGTQDAENIAAYRYHLGAKGKSLTNYKARGSTNRDLNRVSAEIRTHLVNDYNAARQASLRAGKANEPGQIRAAQIRLDKASQALADHGITTHGDDVRSGAGSSHAESSRAGAARQDDHQPETGTTGHQPETGTTGHQPETGTTGQRYLKTHSPGGTEYLTDPQGRTYNKSPGGTEYINNWDGTGATRKDGVITQYGRVDHPQQGGYQQGSYLQQGGYQQGSYLQQGGYQQGSYSQHPQSADYGQGGNVWVDQYGVSHRYGPNGEYLGPSEPGYHQ